MSHLILPFLMIAVLMSVIAVMGAAMKKQKERGGGNGAAEEDPPTTDFDGYERKPYLFSNAEYSFYKVLQLAVGANQSIQAKVRIVDLVEVRKGSARW